MGKRLKIVELGDKILRAKAKVVRVSDIKKSEFKNFVGDLIKTCDLSNGVGIAAPQVNNSRQVFILWPERKLKNNFRTGRSRTTKKRKNVPTLGPLVIINPKIISRSKKIVKAWEGCLSIPGIRGLVPRHVEIMTEFVDEKGKRQKMRFENFTARIFQHEFDHLNGIVFLDRADNKTLVTEAVYKKIIKKSKVSSQKSKSKIKN